MFRFDDRSVSLDWQIPRDADGTISHIEIAASNTPENLPEWEIEIRDFINEVVIAALARSGTKTFRRNLFYCVGPNLDGEYWLPGFRLASAVPDDETPTIFGAERVLYIDQTIEGIDDFHASDLANYSANQCGPPLSSS